MTAILTHSIRFRPAHPEDAVYLHDLRRRSILALARTTMSSTDVERWAVGLSIDGMQHKLRDLEIWIAVFDGDLACWAALAGDRLEGLYTAPEFANRGIGARLLVRVEDLMRSRGIAAVHADASSNAEAFYVGRGWVRNGEPLPNGALPIIKSLLG